ncbi:MAG: putative LPS assembly protein LptD [Bacteroidota bacterium]
MIRYVFTLGLLIIGLTSRVTGQTDTTIVAPLDTANFLTEDLVESEVYYFGKDSTRMDLENNALLLFGTDSYVKYGNLEVKAAFIRFSFEDYTAFAKGVRDSTGKWIGRPIFSEGDQSFEEDSLGYHFKTKRGISYGVRTEEASAYLHSAISKKQSNDWIHIKGGKFTTCNKENPHFHFHLTKAIVIPNEKIVSGPLYLKFRKIPTPLGLPFGFFPNKKESTHGILLPGYGNGREKGFFVQNLGYYFPINEFIETKVLFDVYTGGSWSVRNITNYKKRYKYTGSFNISRTVNKIGYVELPNYFQQTTFNIRWTHNQDPKARPNEQFSANVNLGSSQNFRNNLNASQQDFLSSTFNSALQWNKAFPGKPFTLGVTANHTQNTQTRLVQLTLPSVALNMSRINLLKKLMPKSPIGLNASLNTEQQLSAYEQEFGSLTAAELFKKVSSGVRLNGSASTSWKLGSFVTVNPSATFTGFGTWRIVAPINDAQLDTINGLRLAGNWSTQVTANSRIYGTFVRKGQKELKAARHLIQPSFGFAYTPFQNFQQSGYYGTNGEFIGYSPFDAARFKPSSTGQSANLTFGINQNLEAKIRDHSSAKVAYKKVKVIESFRTNFSHNLSADSLNWSNVNFTAFTTLKFLNLNYSSSYSLYDRDSLGKEVNRFLIQNNQGFMRMEGTNLAVGLVLRSKSKGGAEANRSALAPEEQEILSQNASNFIDFSIPWNATLNYNMRLNKIWNASQQRDSVVTTQAITLMGDVSFNQKVALSFNGGYDMNAKKMTTTTLGVHVDLHCWELSLNMVPFGLRKSYFIQVNIKASMLQDLKLQKRGNLGDDNLLY